MASAVAVRGFFNCPQLTWAYRCNRTYQRCGAKDGHVDARVHSHYDYPRVDVRGFHVSAFLFLTPLANRHHKSPRRTYRCFELVFLDPLLSDVS